MYCHYSRTTDIRAKQSIKSRAWLLNIIYSSYCCCAAAFCNCKNCLSSFYGGRQQNRTREILWTKAHLKWKLTFTTLSSIPWKIWNIVWTIILCRIIRLDSSFSYHEMQSILLNRCTDLTNILQPHCPRITCSYQE